MYYHNNWIEPLFDHNEKTFSFNIPEVEEDELPESLDFYIEQAVTPLIKDKRYCLFLSGGLDSQLTYHCLKRCVDDFDVYIINLSNYNWEDQQSAKMFCDYYEQSFKVLTVDVHDFLENEFEEYVVKEKFLSPQYALHSKAMEQIVDKYDLIIRGGNPLMKRLFGKDVYLSYAQIFDLPQWGQRKGVQIVDFLLWNKEIAHIFSYEHVKRNEKFPAENYNKLKSYSKIDRQFICNATSGFDRLKRKLNEDYGTVNYIDDNLRFFCEINNTKYTQKRYQHES